MIKIPHHLADSNSIYTKKDKYQLWLESIRGVEERIMISYMDKRYKSGIRSISDVKYKRLDCIKTYSSLRSKKRVTCMSLIKHPFPY